MMDISILTHLFGTTTLKIQQIKNSKCPLCKISKSTNLAILEPCQHKICTTCLDKLYDNHEINNNLEDLFNCPFCTKGVIDISYR